MLHCHWKMLLALRILGQLVWSWQVVSKLNDLLSSCKLIYASYFSYGQIILVVESVSAMLNHDRMLKKLSTAKQVKTWELSLSVLSYISVKLLWCPWAPWGYGLGSTIHDYAVYAVLRFLLSAICLICLDASICHHD